MLGGMSAAGGVKPPKKRSRPRGSTCVTFDGANDSITVSDFTWATTGDFSISAWFKYSDDDRNDGVFTQAPSRPNAITFGKNTSDQIDFNATISSSVIIDLKTAAGALPNNNQWYHVVICVDRSSASDSKIYVDGVAATMSTQTIADTTTSIDLAANLVIGLFGNTVFKGSIKEVTFYDVALNSRQVRDIFRNKARGGFHRSKLGRHMLMHLTMGDGGEDLSATTVNDLSGNGNNGTLNLGASFATDSPS